MLPVDRAIHAASLVLQDMEPDSSTLLDTAVQELPLRLHALKLHLVVEANLCLHVYCIYVEREERREIIIRYIPTTEFIYHRKINLYHNRLYIFRLRAAHNQISPHPLQSGPCIWGGF